MPKPTDLETSARDSRKQLNPLQKKIQAVKDVLVTKKVALTKHLIGSGIDFEQFLLAIMTEVGENTKLLQCKPESILKASYKCARWNLMTGPHGHVALIPRALKGGGFSCDAQRMYAGIIHQLLEAIPSLLDVRPYVIYANEPHEVRFGDKPGIDHKPLLVGDPGEVVASYVIFTYRDGLTVSHLIRRSEIDHARKIAQTDNVWEEHFDAMAMKTAIHRGAKYMAQKSIESAKIMGAHERLEDPNVDINVDDDTIIDLEPQEETETKDTPTPVAPVAQVESAPTPAAVQESELPWEEEVEPPSGSDQAIPSNGGNMKTDAQRSTSEPATPASGPQDDEVPPPPEEPETAKAPQQRRMNKTKRAELESMLKKLKISPDRALSEYFDANPSETWAGSCESIEDLMSGQGMSLLNWLGSKTLKDFPSSEPTDADAEQAAPEVNDDVPPPPATDEPADDRPPREGTQEWFNTLCEQAQGFMRRWRKEEETTADLRGYLERESILDPDGEFTSITWEVWAKLLNGFQGHLDAFRQQREL